MYMKMYDQYKIIKSEKEFFSTWEKESLANLNRPLMDKIYNGYIVKSSMLQRDNFTCQHDKCPYCKNKKYHKLTKHHIKFQKNDGEDKLKNVVTLCKGVHDAYHSGKVAITFYGATYKLHKSKNGIDWKAVKKKSKEIRKNHPDLKGIKISFEMMRMLWKFLNVNYKELYNDDE